MKRDYIIITTRYKGKAGSLLFWGTKTEDSAKRSFGGYTSNMLNCERYTLEEIKKSDYKFKRYIKNCNWKNFDDFYIKVSKLYQLGGTLELIYTF